MLGRNLQVLQDLRHGRKGQLALCQPLAGIPQINSGSTQKPSVLLTGMGAPLVVLKV